VNQFTHLSDESSQRDIPSAQPCPQEAHIWIFNIALIALALICVSLSAKPSSNTSVAATRPEARGAPVYGAVHVAVPPGEKAFSPELMPAP
jgi:hypothetical protein